MKIIYDQINALAGKKWGNKELTLANHNEWQELWIACAKEIKNTFVVQGLSKTAKTAQAIIDQQQAYLDADKAKPKGRNNRPILSVKI